MHTGAFCFLLWRVQHTCNKSFSRSQNSLTTSNTRSYILMAIKIAPFRKNAIKTRVDAHIYVFICLISMHTPHYILMVGLVDLKSIRRCVPCSRRMSDRRRSSMLILLQNFLREARERGWDLGRFADRDQKPNTKCTTGGCSCNYHKSYN